MDIMKLVALSLCIAFPAAAQSLPESKVQDCACKGFEQEVKTQAGTWIDCLSDTHAIEVEATQDWAEAIGQSLHYSIESGLKAKIMLFCEQSDESCFRHELTLRSTIAAFDLPIEYEYAPDGCVEPLKQQRAASNQKTLD